MYLTVTLGSSWVEDNKIAAINDTGWSILQYPPLTIFHNVILNSLLQTAVIIVLLSDEWQLK
jgi:hypothetical protein